MITQDHLFFNAFNQLPQIGAVRLRKLLNFFPDLETAWRASLSELRQTGFDEALLEKILDLKTTVDPETEFEKLERLGIRMLTFRDAEFPALLAEIPNPPAILYIKGELLPRDCRGLAVVGTRKYTSYGKQVVTDLVRDLVRPSLTIISGLALGIDAIAHLAAMHYDGRTIAVLASGLDSIHPVSNRAIAEKILSGRGAIVSELPLGMPPLKHHFPYRNRIISGLALGCVVIEAATDSGSLITARHALEQNRQVFAVPGSIYNPASAGPNNLLKMGAKPVTSVSDILEDLNLVGGEQQVLAEEILGDNEEEQKVLGFLTREPQHIDLIVKSLGLPASTVAATLTIMEMKGKIRNLGANQYVKSR